MMGKTIIGDSGRYCKYCSGRLRGDLQTMTLYCDNADCPGKKSDKVKYDHRICTGTMDKQEEPELKSMDQQTMVDGLEGELENELGSLVFGINNNVGEVIDMISALIDARIELDRVNRKAVHGLEKDPFKVGPESEARKAMDSYLDSMSSKPSFIPLTEDHPRIVRNGDRFNVSPCGGADLITVHVIIEKDFIPGLREIEIKPFSGYTSVEPGCPFDDHEYQMQKNKK